MGQFVTVDLTEVMKFKSFMDRISYSYKKTRAVSEELEDIANDMRNYIIDGMTNTKKSTTGYKWGSGTHYPSLPGNMPARRDGGLIGSITYAAYANKIEIGSKIGAPYAVYLEDEEGKRGDNARPFLQPTLDHFSPSIEKRLWKKIKEVTR